MERSSLSITTNGVVTARGRPGFGFHVIAAKSFVPSRVTQLLNPGGLSANVMSLTDETGN